MPGLYRLVFNPSGATRIQRGTRGNYYQLPNGGRLEVWRQPVWCCACRTFTEGEVISELDDIDRMIAQHKQERGSAYRQHLHRTKNRERQWALAMRLADLELRRSWRELRQGPPRCLECGCTELIPMRRGEDISNPNGPGTVRLEWLGMCSVPPREYIYSAEGEFIAGSAEAPAW